MKIKKFNYKSVNSTNDIAINLIKKKILKQVTYLRKNKRKVEANKEKDGFHIKAIYLCQFFLV